MRPIIGAGALALAMAAVACSHPSGSAGAGPADGGGAVGTLSPEEASQVLAHVGDRTITLGDYVAAPTHDLVLSQVRRIWLHDDAFPCPSALTRL